jgi:nucleoside-diphosphate-sugar epimerase
LRAWRARQRPSTGLGSGRGSYFCRRMVWRHGPSAGRLAARRDSDFVYNVVEGQDIVFHLAALIAIPYSYEAPRTYLRTNVEGTLNVLEAARRCGGTRVVHTNTSEVYGTAQRTPIDESHPLQGQSPYSASKIGADKLAESYYRSFATPVITVRPFNTVSVRRLTVRHSSRNPRANPIVAT